MAKNFKKALGSVGPALHDILSAIVETNDLASSNQIKTFSQIVQLFLMAKEAGVSDAFFLKLISSFRIDRASFGSGEIEMAGAASTGFETQEGTALHVDFKAGGSLAGFDLGLNAGYQQSDSSASFERSSQNFRILARWAVGPGDLSDELMKSLSEFANKATPGANIPDMPESFENPNLEMLREMLPLLSELFSDNPADDNDTNEITIEPDAS